jgi:hypothetical protein
MRAHRNGLSPLGTAIILSFLALSQIVAAQAPNRLNDKDLEAVMNNLKGDAKAFRGRFDSAIKKSTIRKTSQAKDAQNLASSLQKQTETLLNEFKKSKKGDSVPAVLATASQIDKFMTDLKIDPQATGWDKIQADLKQVSGAFGVAMPAAASAQSDGVPCIQAVGAERAKKLVDECMLVSPATHPPCNGQNACALITDEIKRGCAMLQQNVPSFCAEYK